MFNRIFPLFFLVLVSATSAYAGDVDDCLSDWGTNCDNLCVSICPAGDFELISDACLEDPWIGDHGYIWIIVRDSSGNGVPGVPWSDYWIGSCDDDLQMCLCANPIVADSLTNSNGETTISGRIAGGGCTVWPDGANQGMWLAVQGKIILVPDCLQYFCLGNLYIKSVDLTADCQVNLSDLGVFGLSYNKNLGDPGYNTCCDYNDDDKCNLSDFAFVGAHYLHECF